MAFEELRQNTEEIQDQAQVYLESNLAYYKLWGFKVAMKSTTMILKFTIVILCFSMVLLFCSIAGAFAIGKELGSYPIGFLIIGGFYLILSLLFLMIKDKVIESPILEKFSEIFFND